MQLRRLITDAGETTVRLHDSVTYTCGSDLQPATGINQTRYRYAVWVEKGPAGVTGSAFPSTLLSDPQTYGQQLKVAQISCNTDRSGNVVSYTIVPAEDVASRYQGRVALTATPQEVADRLFLIYLDTSNTIEVTVCLNNFRTAGATFESIGFGPTIPESPCATNDEASVGTMLLTRTVVNGDSKYVGLLTLSFPRSYGLSNWVVRWSSNGKWQRPAPLTLVDDASTLDRMIQTYQVTVPGDATTPQILGAINASNTTQLMAPTRAVASRDASSSTRLMDYQTCAAITRDAQGVPQPCQWEGGRVYAGSREDYQYDNGTGRYRTPNGAGLTGNGVGQLDANLSRSANGVGVAYTVDLIPQLAVTTEDMYNEALSSVTINNQTFSVAMPQPCLAPNQQTITDADKVHCVGISDATPTEYAEDRGWLLSPNGTSVRAASALPSRLLLDQYVTTGALAGARVRVVLVNARNGVDSANLDAVDTTACLKPLFANNRQCVQSHDTANASDSARWRYRYRIEVIGANVATLSTRFVFATNAQWLYAVESMRGVSPTEDASFDGVMAYGRNDDAGNNEWKWRYLCMKQATGTYPSGCTYFWSHAGYMDDPNVFRFVVRNGYVTPRVVIDEVERTPSRQSAGAAAELPTEHLQVSVPRKTDRRIRNDWNGSQTFYANGNVPIAVNATPMTVNVVYRNADGSAVTFDDDGGDASQGADRTANVDTSYVVSTPSSLPDTGGKVFLGWTLVAYSGQTRGCVIQEGIQPGTGVDIRGLKCADGSRALSDAYGTAKLDTLRFEVASQTAAFSKYPAFYPVARRLLTSPERTETAFSYRAVSGLRARLTDAFLAEDSTQTYADPEAPEGTDPYQLSLAKSETGPLPLASAGSARRLTLAYQPQVARVSFAKTVSALEQYGIKNDTLVKPREFSLVLTSQADATKTYTVADHADPASVPPGTYTLSEIHTDLTSGEVTNETSRWLPTSAGYSCATVKNGVPTLTLTAGQQVTCKVTNEPGVLAILTYEGDVSNRWVQLGSDPSYSYTLRSSNAAAYVGSTWHAESYEDSQRYVTPGVSYGLDVTVPADMTFLRLEKCERTYNSMCTADENSSHWQRVDGDEPITVAGGDRALYRVMVKPTSIVSTVTFQARMASPSLAGSYGTAVPQPEGAPEHFAMTMARTAGGSGSAVTVTRNGATIPHGETWVDAPAGAYALGEVSKRTQATYGADVAYGPTQAGFVCVDNATRSRVNTSAALSLGVGQKVTCRVVNATALASLLTYDKQRQQYVTGASYGAEVSGPEGTLESQARWAAADAVGSTSTRLVTPGSTYRLSPVAPLGRTSLRIERYTGTDPIRAQADSEHWEPIEGSDIAVTAGKHEVYRVVYTSMAEVMLPLTGGRGADTFVLAGAGALLIGLVSALVLRRRRG